MATRAVGETDHKEVAPGASRALGIRLRLVSGLLLLVFALTHFLNHALGLVSLEAMERGQEAFNWVWRSPPGEALLLAALVVHVWLGLVGILRLPSLRMPLWEAVQKVSGLLIPVILIPHIFFTRVASQAYGFDDSYPLVLSGYWPDLAPAISILLLVVWMHGCVGVHFWLRIRPVYRRCMPWLLATAVVIPLLGLGGFMSGGREVARLRAEEGWLDRMRETRSWPAEEQREPIEHFVRSSFQATLLVLGSVIVLRLLGSLVPRRRSFGVSYPGGQEVRAPAGATILATSRAAGIPHASVCGGRGRCSTCRVRVDAGLEHLPPASPRELALLERVRMPENVRLACQVRPARDVAVTPLLPPHVQPGSALTGEPYRYGRELEVAILFSDLRGFTTMTERRLAYDVVFVLNRYFQAMGEAIRDHRGHLVQVFGDGMMALFSAREGLPVACRQALRAAATMAERLEQLNSELEEPLRMGIGLHAGSTVVGEMGYREATIVTAVGEAVNATSRLQDATKEFGCQLVASSDLATRSGADFSHFERHEVELRGLTSSLPVYAVPSARDLPDLGEERFTPVSPLSAAR